MIFFQFIVSVLQVFFFSQTVRKVLNEFGYFLLCINYKIYFSSVKTQLKKTLDFDFECMLLNM